MVMRDETDSVCFSNNMQILQYKITIACYFSSTKQEILQQSKSILVEKQYLCSQIGSHKHKFATDHRS